MIRWVDRDQLLEAVKPLLNPAPVFLDIGCGIRPTDLVPTDYPPADEDTHICVDPYLPYLEKIGRAPGRVLVNCEWSTATHIFPDVDAIYLLDVIEHCEREYGEFYLWASEKIAKQIVIFTPIGFLPQEPEGVDAWGFGGLMWQTHRSGWEPKDFDKPGWEVIAAEGFHPSGHGAFWAVYTKE